MDEYIVLASEEISMFCRLQMQVKKELPVRSSEMGVLIFIKNQDEQTTPLMISSFFQISKPSVTSIINELVKKGYLQKVPSITDRRSYTVSITKKGQELVETVYHQYFKTISLLKDRMGSIDFDLFIRLIKKANKILSEERKQ